MSCNKCKLTLVGGHGAHHDPPRRPPRPPYPRQRASQDVLGLLQGCAGWLPRPLPLASVARSLPLSVPSSGLGAFPSSSLSPLSPTADCSCSYRIWDGQPGGKVCRLVHFMETQHALCPTRLMVSIHTLRKLFMSNWFKMTKQAERKSFEKLWFRNYISSFNQWLVNLSKW